GDRRCADPAPGAFRPRRDRDDRLDPLGRRADLPGRRARDGQAGVGEGGLELDPVAVNPDGAALLAALARRGVRRIRTVRLKRNRSRLLSISRDGATLHAHIAFGHAPVELLDSFAVVIPSRCGGAAHSRAVPTTTRTGRL